MRMLLVCIALFILVITPSQAKEKYAVIVSISGDVTKKSGNSEWISARAKDLLTPGDSIQTKKGAKATLFLEGLAIIKVGEDSRIILKNKKEEISRWVIEIKKGRVWVELQKFFSEGDIELETPFGTAVVKGSVVEGSVDDSTFDVILHEGEADVTSDRETKSMKEGERLELSKGRITSREYTIDDYSIETLKEKIDPANLLETFRENPQLYLRNFVLLRKDDFVFHIYIIPGEKLREKENRKMFAGLFYRQLDTRLYTVIVDGIESDTRGIAEKSRGYCFPSLRYIFFGDLDKNRKVIEEVFAKGLELSPFNIIEGELAGFSKRDLKMTIKSDSGTHEMHLRKNVKILPKNRPLEIGQKLVLMGRGDEAGTVIIRPQGK